MTKDLIEQLLDWGSRNLESGADPDELIEYVRGMINEINSWELDDEEEDTSEDDG
jgi:hypothetical protein